MRQVGWRSKPNSLLALRTATRRRQRLVELMRRMHGPSQSDFGHLRSFRHRTSRFRRWTCRQCFHMGETFPQFAQFAMAGTDSLPMPIFQGFRRLALFPQFPHASLCFDHRSRSVRLPPHDDFPGFLGFPISVANFLVIGFWQKPPRLVCDVIASRRPRARPTIKPRAPARCRLQGTCDHPPWRAAAAITVNDLDMVRQVKFSRGSANFCVPYRAVWAPRWAELACQPKGHAPNFSAVQGIKARPVPAGEDDR